MDELQFPHTLSAKDRELIRIGHNHLSKYLKCLAGKLSPEGYEHLSMANQVIWREMEQQLDLLRDIYDTGVINDPERD